MKFQVFTAVLLSLSFAWSQNLGECLTDSKDNGVANNDQLIKQLTADLNSVHTFEAAMNVNEKYSACPKHEPGTDNYYVFSEASTRIKGNFVVIQYKLLGHMETKDGKKYTLNPVKDPSELSFQLFKTEKGLRFGDTNTRLVLEKGLFLTKKAAQDRFKFE